jgi:hypothetical protein
MSHCITRLILKRVIIPPPNDIHILISGTYECCLIWEKKDFMNVIRLRILRPGGEPGLPSWALNAIPSVLIRESKTATCSAKSQRARGPQKRSPEWCGCKLRKACSWKKHRRILPWGSRGSMVLLMPRFQTLGLDSEKINFFCLKPLSLWSFVTAASGGDTTGKHGVGAPEWPHRGLWPAAANPACGALPKLVPATPLTSLPTTP